MQKIIPNEKQQQSLLLSTKNTILTKARFLCFKFPLNPLKVA